jgi:hypothetical protein
MVSSSSQLSFKRISDSLFAFYAKPPVCRCNVLVFKLKSFKISAGIIKQE